MRDFMERFRFNQDYSLFIGIERECFLTDNKGNIIPIAVVVLHALPEGERFGYELSACQLEDRIGPCELSEVKNNLLKNEAEIKRVESQLNFKRAHMEVAPDSMPLDVYPDPTGRYQEITKDMPKHILLAACRVIGTHIHVGMPDYDTAMRVYNKVISQWEHLCQEGDNSKGKRLEIYRTMAPDYKPIVYNNGWDDFYKEAVEKKFVEDPRSCWHLIRISVNGTIEFRMFGATADINRIEYWAKTCHDLCKKAMEL